MRYLSLCRNIFKNRCLQGPRICYNRVRSFYRTALSRNKRRTEPKTSNQAKTRVGTIVKRELDGLVTQMHSAGVPYADALRQFKRRYILEVLAHHKGNQCKAAEELGMHRNTLSRTLAELDLDTAAIRSGMRRPPTSEHPRTLATVANNR